MLLQWWRLAHQAGAPAHGVMIAAAHFGIVATGPAVPGPPLFRRGAPATIKSSEVPPLVDNPFALLNRILIATGRVLAYWVVFLVQAVAYASMLKKDRIVDAFGYLGRGIADAVASVFKDD